MVGRSNEVSRDAEAKPATREKQPRPKPAKPNASKTQKPKAAAGYDEKTAERIRAVLSDRGDVEERRMFGGLCFMVAGQMCCGLTKNELMVRVGKDGYDDALAQPHARPMDFTGRPLVGFVFVDAAGYKTAPGLAKWVRRGVSFVEANPKSTAKSKSKSKSKPKSKGSR